MYTLDYVVSESLSLKGPSGQIKAARRWYHCKDRGLVHPSLYALKVLILTLKFKKSSKF